MKKIVSRSIFAAFALLIAISPALGQVEVESKSLLVVPLQSATLKKSALSKLNRALTSKVDGQAEFEHNAVHTQLSGVVHSPVPIVVVPHGGRRVLLPAGAEPVREIWRAQAMHGSRTASESAPGLPRPAPGGRSRRPRRAGRLGGKRTSVS